MTDGERVYLRYEFRHQVEAEAWCRWIGLLFGGEVRVEACPALEVGGPGWCVLAVERVSSRGKGGGHGA